MPGYVCAFPPIRTLSRCTIGSSVSLDTLKNVARYEHFLKDTHWDVVIIDEAHNVAGASVPERHLSYRLARLLARRTDSLLLTTATPHNGKRETFGRLIALLDPSAIPDPSYREYAAHDIKDCFLMRFKEDIRVEAGNAADRLSCAVGNNPAEEGIYAILVDLRQAALSAAPPGHDTHRQWQAQALLQYGLYKLFLSSPEACLATVNKRLHERQASCRGEPRGSLPATAQHPSVRPYHHSDRALHDLAASARANRLGRIGRQSSPADLHRIATHPGGHGCRPGTRSSPVRLLLATDVASEGINLHYECHHIIHYDLPWSIITFIQRNGRIDRLRQTQPPIIRYLMVQTQQGLLQGDRVIFERLISKVEEINRLRQSGESALQLYDPQAEGEYIATHGILAGNAQVLDTPAAASATESTVLEALLSQASHEGHAELLRFLLGTSDDAAAEQSTMAPAHAPGRLRLFSDRQFLLEGYRYLAEQDSQ